MGRIIGGAKMVQMIGTSGPTAARMSRSASSCSPRAPPRGSVIGSRASPSASAIGAWVTVYGVAISPEGR
jgi:hypothetical protein